MSSTPAPDRSLQQRMDSLSRANEIRTKRSQFKRDLKAGRIIAYDFILDPPGWLENMKIFDLLSSLPKFGQVKANKILQRVRMSPAKTVGGMTPRQRKEILSYLRRSPN